MHEKLTKYFSNELNPSEVKSLLEEVNNDDNLMKEFVRLQNIYALSQISPLSIDEEEGRIGYHNFKERLQKKKQLYTIRTIMQYAAVVVVIIAATFFTTQYLNNTPHSKELNSLYVPAGQRAQVTLADGSTVWLNANSTLRYPSHFSKKTRQVEVEGEAFFDIAQNKKKPFIVSAKNIKLQVLGTKFNVHSYPETDFVKTDLVEGSVRIAINNSEYQGITLSPSEQLTVSGNNMILSKTEGSDYFLWTDGIYAFDNECLLDIINKLQLYYDVKIIVEDPEIFDVRYTGKFRQRDGIDEILRIIQKIRKFDIKKDTNQNIITLTK